MPPQSFFHAAANNAIAPPTAAIIAINGNEITPATAEITLTGETATTVVGRDLLGRALSGTGEPLDGLPRSIGERRLPIWGAPINPI